MIKHNGCNSPAKKAEQRLHHLAQGFDPGDGEAKNRHDSASRPKKEEEDGRLWNYEESA